jgi:hypothetical protein
MSPQIGLTYAPNDQFFYFFETDIVLIADGPPVGFPQGEKMTGYGGIKLGLVYRFVER